MKTIINILSFILVFGIIYFAITNASDIITLKLFTSDEIAASLKLPYNPTKTISVLCYSLIALGTGLIAGISWVGQFYFAQKEKLNAYKRELEKSSITNSSSTSRVEVLEAKIATLEKALDEALKK